MQPDQHLGLLDKAAPDKYKGSLSRLPGPWLPPQGAHGGQRVPSIQCQDPVCSPLPCGQGNNSEGIPREAEKTSVAAHPTWKFLGCKPFSPPN